MHATPASATPGGGGSPLGQAAAAAQALPFAGKRVSRRSSLPAGDLSLQKLQGLLSRGGEGPSNLPAQAADGLSDGSAGGSPLTRGGDSAGPQPLRSMHAGESAWGRAASLVSFGCDGNPLLMFPPPEIAMQGGEAVCAYIQATCADEVGNRSMRLIALGDAESGKTSALAALISPEGRAEPIAPDTRTVGMQFTRWDIEGQDLSFEVVDLAGQAVYSMTHQFFLVRRAVYLLVWRAVPRREFTAEARRELVKMAKSWVDSLHIRCPGAHILCVCTHKDVVEGDMETLEDQCRCVQEGVCQRLEHYRKWDGQRKVRVARAYKNGRSETIDCLQGEGVETLRKVLIGFCKETPWYDERVPSTYIKLRDAIVALQNEGEVVWLSWKMYEDLAQDCGVSGGHVEIATRFLHDMGVLCYFRSVSKARNAPRVRLENDVMLNSVFVSLPWIVDVVKGLIRHDRDALVDIFTKGKHARKDMSRRVTRLIIHGILHPTLVPFLWPKTEYWPNVDSQVIHDYWEHVMEADSREGQLWSGGDVSKDAHGLERALGLLEGFDVLVARDEDSDEKDPMCCSYLVPRLLAASRRRATDIGVFTEEFAFSCRIKYASLPPGFFERLIVRMRRASCHMDFNATSAAIYSKGDKLQLFNHEKGESTTLKVMMSTVRLWKLFRRELERIERFFPGLQRNTITIEIHEALRMQLQMEVMSQGVNFDRTLSAAGSVNGSYESRSPIKNGTQGSLVDMQRSSSAFVNSSLERTPSLSSFSGDGRGSFHGGTASLLATGKRTLLTDADLEAFERRLTAKLKQAPNVVICAAQNSSSRAFAHDILKELHFLDSEVVCVVAPPKPSKGPLPPVMLLCVDNHLEGDSACNALLHEYASSGRTIVPLILPGYGIKDYSQWWPKSLEVLKHYSIFVQVNGEEWADKEKISQEIAYWEDRRRFDKGERASQVHKLATVHHDPWARETLVLTTGRAVDHFHQKRRATAAALMHDVRNALNEWRGVDPNEAPVAAQKISLPCPKCMELGHDPPSAIDRQECQRLRNDWRQACNVAQLTGEWAAAAHRRKDLISRALGEMDKEAEGRQGPAVPEPTIHCERGHTLMVNKLLSDAATIILESIPCPSCVSRHAAPPWSFSRAECLSFFEENSIDKVGMLDCPKCSKAGLPPVRILDILSPEVFLSYNWGARCAEGWTTQVVVKRFRRHIEAQSDCLCWLDVEGGMSAGDELLTKMKTGVERAHVLVVFLSDFYVNSGNCKREFVHAVNHSKFMIPILVPSEPGDSAGAGWTGPGPSDLRWWKHAIEVCADPQTPDGVEVDWSYLHAFVPIDLAEVGEEKAMIEVHKRILSRLYRGNYVRHAINLAVQIKDKISKWRRNSLAKAVQRKGELDALVAADPWQPH